MITASIVAYKHSFEEIKKVADCILLNKIACLYIIDHSPNDSLSVIAGYSDKIKYIRHENTGYGSGHNVAIREAILLGSHYHAVINPDIYFKDKVLDILATHTEQHSQIGLIMPKIVNHRGELQYLCKLLPSPLDLFFKRFLPKRFTEKRLARLQLKFADYNSKMNVPWLSGCFMFFRVSALKEIGLFDERFFMYGEDIDISRRMHQKYITLYFPEIIVQHVHEAASYTSLKMLKVHIINLIKYFNKWGWFFDPERKRVNRELLHEFE